ncbi:thioredoxin [Pseudomethylobacillus aquaticus]|uniref:Thioredoxin n=1 Tax=Pseudomethylobacillus aquaticus TaxID=2676064 RepID=A0A3N0V0K8_9PROT|nr:thioredoxin family protein [Pseudomethylobacillus aquaticus]ROH86339.1 thioredoxin [Pseudomethylobacillus aquaticus]
MKTLFRTLILICMMLAGSAYANPGHYEASRFESLQNAGTPTLLHVHADWCSTCRTQAPILGSLLKMPEYSGIQALQVSFDDQKDVLKQFNVRRQSTLIVFKNGKEVGRSTGDTSRLSIERLLQQAL